MGTKPENLSVQKRQKLEDYFEQQPAIKMMCQHFTGRYTEGPSPFQGNGRDFVKCVHDGLLFRLVCRASLPETSSCPVVHPALQMVHL